MNGILIRLYRSLVAAGSKREKSHGIFPLQRYTLRDTLPTGIRVPLIGDTVMMRICVAVWLATAVIVMLVAGRSFDQMLLATKLAFVGFTLGYIGALINRAIVAYKDAKSVTDSLRRK